MTDTPARGGGAAHWVILSALLAMLGACAVQPTIPDPSTLKVPTKEIVVTEDHLDAPHEVLGSVEATLGGLHESDLPRAGDAAKQLLRNAAYTKYGERLDAIMNVRTTRVTAGGWFGGTQGLRVEGIAIGIALLPADSAADLSLPEAVEVATGALVSQLQKLPAFLGSSEKHGVVIDPMLEAPSGQQTAATRLLEQQVADRLRSYARFQLLPFQLPRLREAQYLLTGTMRRVAGKPPGTPDVFQINLALTGMKSGTVVARASSRARDDALDTTPTPYYRDSPVLVRDKIVDGYIGTAEMPRKASDRLKVIASTAPSAAPVETPSVNGVASGFLSNP